LPFTGKQAFAAALAPAPAVGFGVTLAPPQAAASVPAVMSIVSNKRVFISPLSSLLCASSVARTGDSVVSRGDRRVRAV
jgi:hypothetical protein